MKVIIKRGQKRKNYNKYIHKCECCKTKFIYDLNEDAENNSPIDCRKVIQCPNCEEYDWIECFGFITDRKVKIKDLERLMLNE